MGAMGFVFILLVLPALYVVLLLTGSLAVVYGPWMRIAVITLISGIYLWFSFRKKYTKRQNDYLENLSLQSGKIEGTEYFYTVAHNQKAKRTTITTYIEGIYGYDFSLKFEGKIERFFKSMGLGTECQSGDTRFDETIYIVSDDEWLCSRLRNDSEIRTLLYDIFWCYYEHGIKVINLRCFDGRILITSQYPSDEQNDPFIRDYVRSVATLLQKAAIHFPSRGSIKDRMYREPSGYTAHIFNIVVLALLANGAIVVFVDMMAMQATPHLVNSFSVVPLSIAVTFAILVAMIWAAIVALRRSSRFSPVSAQIMTLGLLGIFLTSIVEIKEIDVRMDSSAANVYESRVVGKEAVHHRKRGTTYHLYFSPWNGRTSTYDLSVPHSLYVQATEGDIVRIHEHAGYLGYPWIETIEITAQPAIPEQTTPQQSDRTESNLDNTDQQPTMTAMVNNQENHVNTDRTFTQIKKLYGNTVVPYLVNKVIFSKTPQTVLRHFVPVERKIFHAPESMPNRLIVS